MIKIYNKKGAEMSTHARTHALTHAHTQTFLLKVKKKGLTETRTRIKEKK